MVLGHSFGATTGYLRGRLPCPAAPGAIPVASDRTWCWQRTRCPPIPRRKVEVVAAEVAGAVVGELAVGVAESAVAVEAELAAAVAKVAPRVQVRGRRRAAGVAFPEGFWETRCSPASTHR